VADRSTGHLLWRSWFGLVATLLAALSGLLGGVGARSASAAAFAYDAPAVARADIRAIAAAEVGQSQIGGVSTVRYGS
jgi:uncharacterized membrane protein